MSLNSNFSTPLRKGTESGRLEALADTVIFFGGLMKSIKLALLFFLAVLFLQSGCGHSNGVQPLAPTGGNTVNLRSTGGVTGYVFQVNPVFLVDLPSNAPAGSQARSGALIRVLDMNGKVLKEGTTSADGRFDIFGLPPGRLVIEARVDPKSTNPDVSQTITLVPDTTIVLGRRFPIDRDKATSLALQGIEPRARVLATLQPLPPGTSVSPFFDQEGGSGNDVRVTQADEWFFFVDLQPDQMFEHPVQYVFVDANTGVVQRTAELRWFPRLNGAPFWSGPNEYTRNGAAGPEVVQQTNLTQAQPRTTPPLKKVLPQQVQGNEGAFAVILFGYQDHPGFIADKQLVDKFYKDRLPAGQVFSISADGRSLADVKADLEAAFKSVNAAIAKRDSEGLKSTLFFHFGSHGGTVKSFEETSPGKFGGKLRATSSLKTSDTYLGRLSSNNDAVVASAECLDLKAVGYPETATEDTFERKGTTTAAFGQVELETTQTIRVLGLDRLGLVDTKACKVRVVMDSCYSGLLANDLVDKAFMGTNHDLFVIGSSVELGIIDRLGCRFTQAAYIRADIVNADFTGLLGTDGKLLPVLQEFGQEESSRDSQKSRLRTRPGTGHCAPMPDTAPTPTPSPTDSPTPTIDLIDAAGAQGALSAFHQVGVTSCPQRVGTIAINRVANEPVSIQLSVPPGSALFLETPTSFNLSGTGVQLTTRDVFFDCSTMNSFSALVTVTATRLSDGAQEVVEVPVTVEIQP